MKRPPEKLVFRTLAWWSFDRWHWGFYVLAWLNLGFVALNLAGQVWWAAAVNAFGMWWAWRTLPRLTFTFLLIDPEDDA